MGHATINVVFSTTACVDDDSGDGDAVGGKDKRSLEGENDQVAEANKELCRRGGRLVDIISGACSAGAEQRALGGGDGLGIIAGSLVIDVVCPLQCLGVELGGNWLDWGSVCSVVDVVWFLGYQTDVLGSGVGRTVMPAENHS